ncbi:hypothetical protein [Affinirhizobium pseudoryzae]|uniref:hypothetical protein n=1 Tax=Allorhizobium pseudoryzae TaxID=379684 RepID=UPI0013EAD053|nr:hypothetical protein [Allorhizobium pseudoryzae]
MYPGAERQIRGNLELLARGGRAPLISVGYFSARQFEDINFARLDADLHPLGQNEIVFIGRHLYVSPHRDGYSIDDMIEQIRHALAEEAIAIITAKMSCLRNLRGRQDRWGNTIYDQAVSEMTARKPRAELFSVIPKGDTLQPKNQSPP